MFAVGVCSAGQDDQRCSLPLLGASNYFDQRQSLHPYPACPGQGRACRGCTGTPALAWFDRDALEKVGLHEEEQVSVS